MQKRARPVILVATTTLGVVSLVSLFACSQILGVEEIPATAPDAGVDATKPFDAAHDVRHDVRPDTGVDAGLCTRGATRCSSDGLGVETCGGDGGFGVAVACSGPTPVCLGGACACEPGATQCVGQTFQRCTVPDGAAPRWPDGGASCPGTCTLTGCGSTPPSCGSLDGGTTGDATTSPFGVSDCPGVDAGESCCTSNEAPAGSFYLSYDGYSAGDTHETFRAAVSPFRLDRFEVTVGRFRRFANAVTGSPGWLPAPGSGKHAHLNGGQGLADRASDGGVVYEPGWNPAWDTELESNMADLTPAIEECLPAVRAWTPQPPLPNEPGNESLPMNCLSWVQAYAFCIWDGGFLPSEAEWDYAAAGGAEQRIYPWSPPIALQMRMDGGPTETIDCQHANYEGSGSACFGVESNVGERPEGDSKWLHADMAGNVAEWALDVYKPYAPTCSDCAFFGLIPDGGAPVRVRRGGAFVSLPADVLASYRGYDSQVDRSYVGGVRCARTP